MKPTRILFVCLGNICRSPLAEAIFKHKVAEQGIDWIEVDSCGTSNYHIGIGPDARTIANATKNGIAIDHLGRQFCTADFDAFDHILVMDQSNYRNVLRIEGNERHRSKVRMLREFDPLEKGADVPDPYYGGESGFQEVFEILDRCASSFLAWLRENRLKDSKNQEAAR